MNQLTGNFDVIVVGGTPGGIAAAVAAGRLGRSVLLVEYHAHLGGMSSSGLGKSDVEKPHLIGGLFQEFTNRLKQYYIETFGENSPEFKLCRDGYYFEPSVAERIFGEMLGECPNITVLTNQRIEQVTAENQTATAIKLGGRWFKAGVFIDSTYEGDLLAATGAEFRLGRESYEEFKEPHAGEIYFDYQAANFLPGTTGKSDNRLPAYTYRLCLSTRPENSVRMESEPDEYDRKNYTGYFEDLKSGRLSGPKSWKPDRGYESAHFNTMMRAFSVTTLPNGKTDVNINPRPLAFPFGEENMGYVEGNDSQRLAVCRRIRNLVLGLLYFLQNDSEVPSEHRSIANQYHLPLDEFTDTDHFPFQLYVREARRLVGEYTLTEHDITALGGESVKHHPDTIAIGEFPIDSFPCRKRQPGDEVVLEGYLGMLDYITRPYEIPYRIMIPKTIDGLIVPVAASTTHVAFSSIRMEPTWMALGQAAGTAAHVALTYNTQPRSIPIDSLRQQLLSDGQVLKHFKDRELKNV